MSGTPQSAKSEVLRVSIAATAWATADGLDLQISKIN
jgi:hypothetical protein